MSDSLPPHGLQHARPLCSLPTPGVYSNSCPLNWWPSNHLILCCSLLLNLSQHQGLFQWVGSSLSVAKVLELHLQHQSCQWIFSVDFFFQVISTPHQNLPSSHMTMAYWAVPGKWRDCQTNSWFGFLFALPLLNGNGLPSCSLLAPWWNSAL